MEVAAEINYSVPIFRVALVRESEVNVSARPKMSNSMAVEEIARTMLKDTDREQFIVFMLNGKNRVIGANVVSVGSLNASLVHPREVFKPAILQNAAALILVHNHPSGDPEPSAEDRQITLRLCDCGDLFGIKIIDHIILGEHTRFSFLDSGLMPRMS